MVNTKNIGIIAALLITALIVTACTSNGSTNNNTNNQLARNGSVAGTSGNNPPATNNARGTRIKLADSQFANAAFLISGDTLDSAAQQAISGFKIDKQTMPDGTTKIVLSSNNPEYQNQSYTLQKGQSLYFIETRMGDDGNGQEFNLGDDTAVIVDADGYIVQ